MVHLSRQRRLRHRDEHGVLAVVVAASAVMIFVLAALVVDLGLARDTRRQAQNTADAAALAAGNALYTVGISPKFTESVAAAKQYAADNLGIAAADWSSCTDAAALVYQPGGTQCISYDSPVLPKEVRVVVPSRTVDTPLASVIGTDDVQVSAAAQMRLEPNVAPRCALCVLGSGPHDLQNGQINVSGGDIHFNGNVSIGPNGMVATGGDITVEGTASGSLANYDPDPLTGQPRIRDPLEFMSSPDYSALVPRTNPCLSGPGIYGDFSSGCVNPLTPGLYVITGLWKFSGNENLIAPGVTLYFTCGTPASPRPCNLGEGGGWLDATGNGTIRITAPTTGPTKGIAIWYDRNNTQQIRLAGNGGSEYDGTIYATSATLDYRGNGAGVMDPNTLLVVASVKFSGSNAVLNSMVGPVPPVDMPPADLHLSK